MLSEIRKQYLDHIMNSDQYDEALFQNYHILFEFSSFIEGSTCEKIEITEKGILCYFRYGGRNLKMYLNETDYTAVPAQIINYGDYEPYETDMVMEISKYLNKNSVIFDIGSNLGWYSLNFMADHPDFQCYMFEPAPETYQRLCENIEANGMDSGFCQNIGLYKENTVLDFFYDVRASGASSLSDLFGRSTTDKIKCPMRRMDDFIRERGIEGLDFIKCDVEGSELFVYQGGLESIKKYKPVIFSEMLRKWSARFGYHPNDIIRLLAEIGYSCYVISEKDKKLKRFYTVDEQTAETNYFFLCEDRHEAIIKNLCMMENRPW